VHPDAELANKPIKSRLVWRKESVANGEAANSANQPKNDLKNWEGTYHRDRHLSFALYSKNQPLMSQVGHSRQFGFVRFRGIADLNS